jgi:thioredoxin 1
LTIFVDEIAQGITLVDFWAEWCGPCKMIAPMIEELSEEIQGAAVAKLDVDENPEVSAEFGIRSIPTLIVYKDGQEVDRVVGGVPKATLINMIEAQK